MSLLVKITLSAALILSIAVPFGAFAAGEKTKGRYKTALAANLFLFFGTMVFAAAMPRQQRQGPRQPARPRQAWDIFQLPFQPDFPAWAAASRYQLRPALPLGQSVRTAPFLVNH